MILQSDKYSCGAAALVNALEAIGHRQTVDVVGKLAGTCPVRGTTSAGARRALKALGFQSYELAVVDSAPQAVAALRGCLAIGHPVLLAADAGEHWIAAIGAVGRRILVADSADGDLVMALSPTGIAKRWKEQSGRHQIYFGVVVVPS